MYVIGDRYQADSPISLGITRYTEPSDTLLSKLYDASVHEAMALQKAGEARRFVGIVAIERQPEEDD